MWRAFPDSRPWSELDDLTVEELLWIHMQMQIDDGLRLCDACDHFGVDRYCGHCGARFFGDDLEFRECPASDCRAQVNTPYCPRCGTAIEPPEDIDWDHISAVASAGLHRLAKMRPDILPMPPEAEEPV